MTTGSDRIAFDTRSGRIDEDVLEEVIRQDGRGLLAFARLVTGHEQDAEDALQEAFTKVAGRRLSRIGNLRAYLYKAVRNAALNGSRARHRRSRREQTVYAHVPLVFQEPADRQEEIDALNRAIAALKEDQREVILMKVWGSLSFSEVADVLGIPRDTAASRYRYAIDALRKSMRRHTDGQR